jgi:hypothetical protein
MSKPAFDAPEVRKGLIAVMFGPGQLCMASRKKGGFGQNAGR